MIHVTKRNGVLEPLDIDKVHNSLEWAVEGLSGVSVSEIALAAKLHFYDGIPTSIIHKVMIKTAKDMITLRSPNYSYVAANLLLQEVYSNAFNAVDPIVFRDAVKINCLSGLYRKELYQDFSEEEFIYFETIIDHSRDLLFSHAGLDQLLDKYAIFDNGRCIESPQHMFMAIAMDMFRDYKNRNIYITKVYNALSTFKISLPTPMMKALRTPSCDYASCITINIGDSIDSWTAGKSAIIKHTVAGAGIGIDISSVASINDPVKGGAIRHSGKIPLMRAIDADIQTSTQMGRRGQAVTYINFFDPEIETILAIKSPRTEVVKRINDLKHGIKFNQLVYDRAKAGTLISLFSPRQHQELITLFNSNKVAEFTALYEKLEAAGLYSSQIPARDLLDIFTTERFENGVFYVLNIDEANTNCSYTEPITQSNICVEFLSPTKPISTLSLEPDIGVCILTNINQADVSLEDLPDLTDVVVRGLNNIITRQNHPTAAANAFVDQYASLGIGMSNHAYYLAKNGVRYGSPAALKLHDTWMEHFQFGLLTASNNVAKEFGPIPLFHKTTYSLGILPIDRYKKTVDELVPFTTSLDWESLRTSIVTHGLANAALSMVPPSESSSIVGNQTSSLDPIRNLLTIKGSKTNTMLQVAPEAIKLSQNYDCSFDRPITKDFLRQVAVTQKWIDQSTSANTFYNPELYPEDKIPQKDLIADLYFAKYYGIKTLYYNNTKSADDDTPTSCGGEGCAV